MATGTTLFNEIFSPTAISVSLLQDVVKYALYLGIIALVLTVPVTIVLLRSNRARGRGKHTLYLADRYIQVWQSRQSIASVNQQPTAWSPGWLGETVCAAALDERLEKLYLVKRYQQDSQWMVRRKGGIFWLYNWGVYFCCKWILIGLCGDATDYYRHS